MASPDDRVSIPLYMLRGNMETLLENEIEVQTIQLKWYGPKGVVLTVVTSDEQEERNQAKGFRTRKLRLDES